MKPLSLSQLDMKDDVLIALKFLFERQFFLSIFLVQSQKPIDLVFAIDVTDSIGRQPERLDYFLQFVENVTERFNMSFMIEASE